MSSNFFAVNYELKFNMHNELIYYIHALYKWHPDKARQQELVELYIYHHHL